MEFILVEEDASQAAALARALTAGAHEVSVVAADAVGARGWPEARSRCSAILIGFDRPGHATVRALHRLWSATGMPPCYLLTSARSCGEALLSTAIRLPPDAAMHVSTPGLHCRLLKRLSMERLLALDQVVRAQRPGNR